MVKISNNDFCYLWIYKQIPLIIYTNKLYRHIISIINFREMPIHYKFIVHPFLLQINFLPIVRIVAL